MWNVEPNAAEEISNDQSNDYHTNHFVEVKNIILLNNLFVIIWITSKTFQHVFNSIYIDQFCHSWQPQKSNKLKSQSIISFLSQHFDNPRKWEDGNKINNQPTKQVLFCNSFKIRNMLISIFMSEALEEIKNEIQIKESFKTLIKDTSPWLIWWGKSNIVHICCARIPNQNENPHVEHRFPFWFGANDQAFLASLDMICVFLILLLIQFIIILTFLSWLWFIKFKHIWKYFNRSSISIQSLDFSLFEVIVFYGFSPLGYSFWVADAFTWCSRWSHKVEEVLLLLCCIHYCSWCKRRFVCSIMFLLCLVITQEFLLS